MTPILLHQLRNVITSPLISIFCKKFEENELHLRKSIDASICTVLVGLEKIMDNSLLYDRILESITFTEFYKSTKFENGKISSINYSFEQEGGIPLNTLFSTKKERISEMISNEVGIKSGTACAILNFAAMLILLHLANEKQKTGISQNDLNSQKKLILNNVPEGIRVLLGYSDFECEDAYADSNTLVKTKPKPHFFYKIFKI
ncbi:DUF937 domain-containing protein [Flavobacterium gilvum]|uniref:Uncharacterized protein n=1 Tax=Flavobacterium gilvum TaxID=1492737 RepID=A0AAC9N5I7_9FLAO|nr:DUF937 domain-containing protein [Flavobacterium gilvum]AOW08399.1 hypothetical protein EM308_02145 [Flavobacterium gilvum]KFC58325.1 hypothetical protein FEM08_28830 [Flavobacterium gilvum]